MTDTAPRRIARALPAALAALVALAIVAAVVLLLPGTARVRDALLGFDLTAPGVLIVADVLALGALAAVLVRRWRRRPALVTAGLGLLGAGIGVLVLTLADAQLWFGIVLDPGVWAGVIPAFAAVGVAAGSLVDAPAWRRAVGAAAIVLALLAGFLDVNAVFGIDRSLADLAGITLAQPVHLPVSRSTTTTARAADAGPLWSTWHAPAGMPAHGTTGQVSIPATISGFHARPAGLYLPPAALVPNAPALPLVIMMMGQPGNPDPSFTANALDALAARHDGLAPIVVVADQLGSPGVDPLCLDTARYGKVATYITQDVLGWARSHLHVLQDAADTVVAGYSNGGECAASFAARDPQDWSNVLDISGESKPGSEHGAAVTRTVFGGNAAAYRATWIASLLAGQHQPQMFAVLTTGANDSVYGPQARTVQAAAQAAGWATTFVSIPGVGHVGAALTQGLANGYADLFPRLGLSRPGVPG